MKQNELYLYEAIILKFLTSYLSKFSLKTFKKIISTNIPLFQSSLFEKTIETGIGKRLS